MSRIIWTPRAPDWNIAVAFRDTPWNPVAFMAAARATLEEFLRVAEEDMAIFPGRKLAAWEDYWHGAIE